jgi:hypothetical protein
MMIVGRRSRLSPRETGKFDGKHQVERMTHINISTRLWISQHAGY